MVNFALLGAVAAIAGLASAAPAPSAADTLPSINYKLMTKVIVGESNKGGLYVTTYHTGAGFNDATLVVDEADAPTVVLNGTQLYFTTQGASDYGVQLVMTTTYAEWEPVQINAGSSDTGFSISADDQSLTSSNPEFVGWFVCDWSHAVPQLFWQYLTSPSYIPSSCAEVSLIAVDA